VYAADEDVLRHAPPPLRHVRLVQHAVCRHPAYAGLPWQSVRKS
jgi:hypothetical protein